MIPKNLLSGLLPGALAVPLLVGPMTAGAGTITATIPGSGFLTLVPGNLGTFNFVIPSGEVAASAQVALNNINVTFVNSANFFLDGVLLGSAGFGSGQNLLFDLSDLSVLDNGAAALTVELKDYLAGCPCVIPNGGETLTIVTESSIPEPGTLPLLALSLLALGAVRIRALGGQPIRL